MSDLYATASTSKRGVSQHIISQHLKFNRLIRSIPIAPNFIVPNLTGITLISPIPPPPQPQNRLHIGNVNSPALIQDQHLATTNHPSRRVRNRKALPNFSTKTIALVNNSDIIRGSVPQSTCGKNGRYGTSTSPHLSISLSDTAICDARLADSILFCTVQSLSFFWAYSFHRVSRARACPNKCCQTFRAVGVYSYTETHSLLGSLSKHIMNMYAYTIPLTSAFADQPPTTDQRPIVNGNRHGRNKMADKERERTGMGLFPDHIGYDWHRQRTHRKRQLKPVNWSGTTPEVWGGRGSRWRLDAGRILPGPLTIPDRHQPKQAPPHPQLKHPLPHS
ncbi:hypothetical protein J6590_064563 [Homalodisca vitripennis]|nr:hypothetical protein J6590_064563 [Homalodisca vitripennis]